MPANLKVSSDAGSERRCAMGFTKLLQQWPVVRQLREGDPLALDDAMQMIAQRIIDTRRETWEEKTPDGAPANRTTAIAHLGGATLDNEENYLIKKLYTALGIVAVENQARI